MPGRQASLWVGCSEGNGERCVSLLYMQGAQFICTPCLANPTCIDGCAPSSQTPMRNAHAPARHGHIPSAPWTPPQFCITTHQRMPKRTRGYWKAGVSAPCPGAQRRSSNPQTQPSM